MWAKFEQEKKLVGGPQRRLHLRRGVSGGLSKVTGKLKGKSGEHRSMGKGNKCHGEPIFSPQTCKARWCLVYN